MNVGGVNEEKEAIEDLKKWKREQDRCVNEEQMRSDLVVASKNINQPPSVTQQILQKVEST